MKNCVCCFDGCGALAVIEIRDMSPVGCGYTHACADHVESLRPADKHTLHKFRISGDSDTVSETPNG